MQLAQKGGALLLTPLSGRQIYFAALSALHPSPPPDRQVLNASCHASSRQMKARPPDRGRAGPWLKYKAALSIAYGAGLRGGEPAGRRYRL
jgi:hypothetical protein